MPSRSHRFEPLSKVGHDPQDVVLDNHYVTNMNTDPHTYPSATGPRNIPLFETQLHGQGTVEGIGCGRKLAHHGVADGLDKSSPMRGYQRFHYPIVVSQCVEGGVLIKSGEVTKTPHVRKHYGQKAPVSN